MKVSNIQNQSFKAKFISNVNIKKYDEAKDEYIDKKSSVVELDPWDRNDVIALNDAITYWDKDLFGSNIAYSMQLLSECKHKQNKEKIYALTLQNSGFDNLISDDIQGVVDIYDGDKMANISYLQVNPDLVYTLEPPKYRHVGKALVTTLQDKYKDKAIILNSLKSSVSFYKNLGFEKFDKDKNDTRYIWNKTALNSDKK